MKVRTRNAPSPTGIPHIGTARQALFNYLLAKKYQGKFILRIEDTDQKRFVPESIEAIYEIHEFLGLISDESPKLGGPYGPYIQTERLEIYQKYIKQLITKGIVYKDNGAIRIKMPETGYTVWKDLVQGKISIPNNEVDNKVLLKSNGIPTYHLAVVIDDHLMRITHVIRGVEWIVSTPVHIRLYQALGWELPIFMHVPLLLGADKSKLSKRHNAKSVLDYKALGYLPEAINNFLFYLGNSYQDNSTILTLDQMVNIFDESKLQKQNAIFDPQKLDYFNKLWIKKIPLSKLIEYVAPFIDKIHLTDKAYLSRVLEITRDRMITLADFQNHSRYFFAPPKCKEQAILEQSQVSNKKTQKWLLSAKTVLSDISDFNSENIHTLLKIAQEKSTLSPRQAFMCLRLSLTGELITPPIFDVISVLGKKESISRLDSAINRL